MSLLKKFGLDKYIESEEDPKEDVVPQKASPVTPPVQPVNAPMPSKQHYMPVNSVTPAKPDDNIYTMLRQAVLASCPSLSAYFTRMNSPLAKAIGDVVARKQAVLAELGMTEAALAAEVQRALAALDGQIKIGKMQLEAMTKDPIAAAKQAYSSLLEKARNARAGVGQTGTETEQAVANKQRELEQAIIKLREQATREIEQLRSQAATRIEHLQSQATEAELALPGKQNDVLLLERDAAADLAKFEQTAEYFQAELSAIHGA